MDCRLCSVLKKHLERLRLNWQKMRQARTSAWASSPNHLMDMQAWARCVVAAGIYEELVCLATASGRMRRAKIIRLTPFTCRRKTRRAWAVQSDFPQLVVARTDMERVWLGMFAVEENERKALFEWRCKDMYGMNCLNSSYYFSKDHAWQMAVSPRVLPLILSPDWSWFLPSSTRAQAPRRVCLAAGLPTGVPSSRKSVGEFYKHSTQTRVVCHCQNCQFVTLFTLTF